MATKFIETTGRTEEQAIEEALQQLGLTRDDVSVEILELPKSGFLGLGTTPAKVRVTYETVEEEPVPEEPAEESTPAPDEPVKDEKAEGPAAEESAQDSGPAAAEESKEETPAPEENETPSSPDSEEDDGVEQEIRDFLTGLTDLMGIPTTATVEKQEDNVYQVTLDGEEDMGTIIGRKGATLDAIQQLTSRVVNRKRPRQRVRIHMDVGGYRSQREESLQRQAVRVAEKVVLYQRNVAMQPMNAYERHVVHVALQDYPGVTTYSSGEEPNRQVIVALAEEEE